MKKILVAALAVGLVAGSLAAPSFAGKKKKTKAVTQTLYFHGNQPAGEAEINETWLDGILHKMDTTEPSGTMKSQFVTNYVGGPNTNCSGNGLLPVWKGDLVGNVSGDLKIELHTLASPGSTLVASLYPDASGGCNESAQPFAAQETVDVAPGQSVTEIVFKKVKFQSFGSLAIQFHMAPTTAGQVRILYDSADTPSSVTLTCTPTSGKVCAPTS